MHPFRVILLLGIVIGTLALVGCVDATTTVAPTAAFTFSPTTPTVGQTATFTDISTNTPTSWTWTFGDDSTSTSQNPTHAYTTSGTYTVNLTATNTTGSTTASHAITVTTAATFTLSSSVAASGGTFPIDYTLDGSGASPDLTWSNPPTGTNAYALLLTTLPGDGSTLWNWVLYNIPATTTSLARNTSGVGTAGKSSHTLTAYAPPQSTGPGAKVYTFTLYALSAAPNVSSDPTQVTGDVLTQAIAPTTLGSASLSLSYTRQAPVVGFTFQTSFLAATFTDASGLSTASRVWTFGDGTSSTETDPSHTYATDGTYTVTLTATNDFGSAPLAKSVTVSSTSSTPVSAFSQATVFPSTNQSLSTTQKTALEEVRTATNGTVETLLQ